MAIRSKILVLSTDGFLTNTFIDKLPNELLQGRFWSNTKPNTIEDISMYNFANQAYMEKLKRDGDVLLSKEKKVVIEKKFECKKTFYQSNYKHTILNEYILTLNDYLYNDFIVFSEYEDIISISNRLLKKDNFVVILDHQLNSNNSDMIRVLSELKSNGMDLVYLITKESYTNGEIESFISTSVSEILKFK